MDLTEFELTVDRIEIDPRPALKRNAAHIRARELRDIPPDLAVELSGPRLERLAEASRVAIESGRFDKLADILNEFSTDLHNAAVYERTKGRLRPAPTAADQIKSFTSDFERCRWNRYESSCLLKMLKAAERIVSIGYREIRTSERTITRADLRTFADSQRPAWGTDDEFFARNFTAAALIDSAEEESRRARASERTYSAGPAAVIGKAF